MYQLFVSSSLKYIIQYICNCAVMHDNCTSTVVLLQHATVSDLAPCTISVGVVIILQANMDWLSVAKSVLSCPSCALILLAVLVAAYLWYR